MDSKLQARVRRAIYRSAIARILKARPLLWPLQMAEGFRAHWFLSLRPVELLVPLGI